MTPPSAATVWTRWLDAAAELVWPRVCLLCDQGVTADTPAGSVCAACRTAVLADPHPTCPRCTSTVGPHSTTAGGCLRCRGHRYRFEGAVRLGPYDGLLRAAVLRMKSAGGEPLAETLGRLWAADRREQLLAARPDVVVPVPLHWRRRWSRGYNQSQALAEGLAAGLGRPCRPAAVTRVRATPGQPGQSPAERWANVKDAFRPKRAGVRGLTVLLVDDVMTTGATADAAAAALKAAGAAQVRLAVLAHR